LLSQGWCWAASQPARHLTLLAAVSCGLSLAWSQVLLWLCVRLLTAAASFKAVDAVLDMAKAFHPVGADAANQGSDRVCVALLVMIKQEHGSTCKITALTDALTSL